MSAPDVLVPVDGLSLHCRVEGREGAPWLVFSNSLMTDLTLWDAQVATFADRFRILRYDQRGHGGSTVPQEDCTFARLADDLLALLDHFGIARAALVGVSMGGVTVMALAARHPERVSHVAICDCSSASSASGAAAWDERMAVAREGGMAALVEPTLARWFRPETLAADPPALGRVRTMIAHTPREGFLRAAPALQNYDLKSAPAALACPAAFMVGAQDGVLPEGMRAMAKASPDATFSAIPDAGHLPNLERPAAFDAALAALLDR